MLAVRAEPADFSPTTRALSLNALSAFAQPDDRAWSVRYLLCPVSLTHDPARCVEAPTGLQVLGDSPSLTLEDTVLEGAPERLLIVAFCPGNPARFDQSRGTLACPDEHDVPYAQTVGQLAFRTLKRRAVSNQNPTITGWTLDTQPQDLARVPRCVSAPCAAHSVSVRPEPLSAETLPEGTRELLTLSVYAGAGTLDRPRVITTQEAPEGVQGVLTVQWTAPPVAGLVRVWFVLRDDRGGVTVREGTIDVTE